MKANIKSNKARGFTIIELLVVIVVIGILTAITIVSYNGVTGKAKNSSAQAQFDAVSTAAETFYASNDRYPFLKTDFTAPTAANDISSRIADVFTATVPTATSNTAKVTYYPCYTSPAAVAAKVAAPTAALANTNSAKIIYYNSSGNTTAYLGANASAATEAAVPTAAVNAISTTCAAAI